MGISAIGISKDVKDALFVLGLVCAMAAGGVAGGLCPTLVVGMYSVAFVCLFIVVLLSTHQNSGLLHQFFVFAIPLFLICSSCSAWISHFGVLRK